MANDDLKKSGKNDRNSGNKQQSWQRGLENKRNLMGRGSRSGGDADSYSRLVNSRLYRIADRICVLVLMNLCMLLLTVCGLVIFGLFPALMAGAEYYNDVLGHRDGNMLSRMFGYFKKNFVSGNLLMVLTVPTVLAGLYLFFGEEVSMYFYLSGFFWMILVALLNGYLPAVSTLYPDFTLGKKLAFSLVAAFTKWYWSLVLVAFGAVWIYLVLLMPQLFGFVLLSGPAAVGMWVGRKALLPKEAREKEEDEDA